MKSFPKTKDELRVERSIKSIMAKCEISMMLQSARANRRHFESEQRLQEYCESHGLIYSPTKYPYYENK